MRASEANAMAKSVPIEDIMSPVLREIERAAKFGLLTVTVVVSRPHEYAVENWLRENGYRTPPLRRRDCDNVDMVVEWIHPRDGQNDPEPT